jgi:phage I-like protein
LLQYLNKLLPSTEESNEDSIKLKEDRIQEALKAEEWKKAKFEILKSKRDNEDEFTISNKKKNKKKNQNKEKEETTVQTLNHQFDALNSFDSIKVSPPLFVDKIPDAVKLLKEKQEYFLKLQDEAVKADEEKRAAKAEEAKQETAVN